VAAEGLIFGRARYNFTTVDFGDGPLSVAFLNGLTVRQFLDGANSTLGGGPSLGGLPYYDIDALTATLNITFDQGNVTPFAQDHLVAPASGGGRTPPAVPEPSSLMLLGSGLLGLAATRRWRRRLARHHSSAHTNPKRKRGGAIALPR